MCEMDNYTVSGEQRLLNNRVIFHLAACSKTVECQTKTVQTQTGQCNRSTLVSQECLSLITVSWPVQQVRLVSQECFCLIIVSCKFAHRTSPSPRVNKSYSDTIVWCSNIMVFKFFDFLEIFFQ